MREILILGSEAGAFTLPSDLVAACRAEDNIQAVLDEQPFAPETVEDARRQFCEAVLKSATAGKPLPNGSELIKARAAAEVQGEIAEVLREALRQAGRHAKKTFNGLQQEILIEHLRPAFEDTISKARKAKDEAEIRALANRYGWIRGARSALHLLVPQVDTFGTFAELRDLDQWWPQFYPERARELVQGKIISSARELRERKPAHMTPAPWPSEMVARFRWIIDNCQPWLPTPQEQDARFQEYLAQSRAELAEGSRSWHEQHWAVS